MNLANLTSSVRITLRSEQKEVRRAIFRFDITCVFPKRADQDKPKPTIPIGPENSRYAEATYLMK